MPHAGRGVIARPGNALMVTMAPGTAERGLASAHPFGARRRDHAPVRRHLFLLRHAKSSWDDPALPDHDRPLAPRGEKAVRRLREHLRQIGAHPDLVICSSARRTTETLAGIRQALPEDAEISIEQDVYLADADTLLGCLRRIDPHVRSVLLVGHNPGTEDLAVSLVGTGAAEPRALLAERFPTAALAHLTFDVSWADLAPGTARLVGFFVPRPPRPST